MSIASEITRLQGVKSDILTAIGNKGVTVPAGSALDDCPVLIGDIPSGVSLPITNRFVTASAENGIDFEHLELISNQGTFNTEQYDAITQNYELTIEIKIDAKKSDNALFCAKEHYKSIDLQYTNNANAVFIGIPNESGDAWYNWNEQDNKRIINLSDYGIYVNTNEYHKFELSYSALQKRVLCYMDNIKIADNIISITPLFSSSVYNLFANYDNSSASRSSGRIKLETFKLVINGTRVI